MMHLAFRRCFADPAITSIVIDLRARNARAHKLYQHIGFVPVGRRMFGENDCLVHRLSRESCRVQFPED